MNPPSVVTWYRHSTITRYASTIKNVNSAEYSYMLPHGVRPAAIPRPTIDRPFATRPAVPTTTAAVWNEVLRKARYANDSTIAAMYANRAALNASLETRAKSAVLTAPRPPHAVRPGSSRSRRPDPRRSSGRPLRTDPSAARRTPRSLRPTRHPWALRGPRASVAASPAHGPDPRGRG